MKKSHGRICRDKDPATAKRAFKRLIQLLALNLLQNSVPQVVQGAQKFTRTLQEGSDFKETKK